jgi:hypothetical protein
MFARRSQAIAVSCVSVGERPRHDPDEDTPMTHQLTRRRRSEEPERGLDRSRRLFLLARAQLAAGTKDSRVDAARRRWPVHRRRFD